MRGSPRPVSRIGRIPARLLVIASIVVVLAGTLVALTLRRADPPTFAPSSMEARPAEGRLVGPRSYTVDASEPHQWVYFSFSRGSVVEGPGAFEWDLAFRRFRVIANGGDGFSGMGGIRELDEPGLGRVSRVPTDGYMETRTRPGDSINAAVERWYDYSFFSHLLMPKPRVYAVRTADGRYAAMEFLGYYCPGARPGCVTFRYVYQGGGGPDL